MRAIVFSFLLLLLPITTLAEEPISLESIYQSIDSHHPQILSDQAKIRSSDLLKEAALGKFDPVLENYTGKYVESQEYDGFTTVNSLKLPLDFNLGELRAGHRYNEGEFPSYDDIKPTRDGGEAFLALKISLLKGLDIDSRRAELSKSQIESELAREEYNISKLELRGQALTIFCNYYTAYAAQNIYSDLLSVAKVRSRQYQDKVRAGAKPEIDLTENERLVSQRLSIFEAQKGKVKALEQTLKIFLRNENGQIQQSLNVRPSLIPRKNSLDNLDYNSDLAAKAAELRPEIRIAELQIKKMNLARELAENNILPDLTVGAEVSQDIGAGSEPEDDTESKVFVGFEYPLYQREARNKYNSLNEDISAEQLKLRYQVDKINAEIKKLQEMYAAGKAQLKAVKSELEHSITLESAERIKLEKGDSNILFVNIREAGSAEARLKLENIKSDIFELQERIRLFVGLN